MIKPRLPVINWNNPITKGLVFDTPIFEKGGSPLDIIGKGKGTVVGATYDTNLFGPDLDFSASTSKVSYTTGTSVNSQALISVEMLFYFRGTGGSAVDTGFGRLFEKGNNAVYEIYNNDNSTANSFSFIANRSTTLGAWASPTNTLGKWYHLVITYDSTSTSNNPSGYSNGVPFTFTRFATPVGTLKADDTNLYVGNYQPGTGNWNGKISYCRVWNRILNPQEAKQLYSNPWQIYQRPPPNLLYNLPVTNDTVNIFDSVTTAESITPFIPILSNVSDSITVAESITSAQVYQPSTFDSVNISENVTSLVPYANSSIFDSVNVSESITPTVPVQTSISDSINVSESTLTQLNNYLAISDAITVGETIQSTSFQAILTLAIIDNLIVSSQFSVFQPGYYVKNSPFYYSIGTGLSIMLGRERMSYWVTAGRPANPRLEEYGFNTDLQKIETWNGTSWVPS